MGEKRRILLIDDERDFVELLQMALKEEDFEVQIAYEGKEALEILKDHVFDFIVCDVNMPGGLSGVRVFEKVRERGLDTAVIFVTGHAKGSDDLADAEKAGVPILSKPVFVSGLLKAIEDYKNCPP